jgi:thiol:disulfide interchange protein DsbD
MPDLALSAAQIQQGSLPFLAAVAYAGGLATAFTPCVYPLIPVTLGIMGSRGTTSTWRAFGLALIFVLGLATVYSGMGFMAASTGKLLGSAAQSPWITWGVALLFLAMGLSLLGLFEIRLPHSFTSLLARQGGSGVVGCFTLGAVSGLLAAPCSGPVVVGILGYVAQKSNPFFGFLLLCFFSLGLGTPFLVLGAFSSLSRRLPATGVWTEWVKHVAGLAMIAAFLLYVRGFFPSAFFKSLVAVGLLAVAVAAPKIFPLEAGKAPLHHPLRALLALLACVLLWGAWRSPSPAPASASSAVWISSLDEGLKKAAASNKPIVVDFWAEWCTACHELDKYTYSDAAVRKRLDEVFVTVKVDATDAEKPEVAALLKKYAVTGLPTVLFLSPQGKPYEDLTLTGFVPADEFLELLNQIPHDS